MPKRSRSTGERGFALLMVFVMSAIVAIVLFMELPRVAFESQRIHEQMLIDRGEQYKRAIQLFYRKNKRFPASMDELEKFQEVRFLRRRYPDPMTGKDDWRLIHVGPGGVLTDSLVQKQNQQLGPDGKPIQNPGFSSSGSSSPDSASAQDPSAQGGPPPAININGVAGTAGGINMAIARRPSDQMALGVTQSGPPAADSNDPNNPSQPQPNQPPANQPQPNPAPGSPFPQGFPPGLPGVSGQPQQPGQPGVSPDPNQPYVPNSLQPYNPNNPNPGANPINNPNLPFNPNQPYNPNPYGAGNPANPGQPGNLGQPQLPGMSYNNPAQTGGQPQNAATAAIQSQLFSPRPQQSSTSAFSSGVGSNTQASGGIAGVATAYKGSGIKIVNERKKYQEWEFIYDLKKDKSVVGAAAVQQQGNLQNQQNQTNGLGGTGPGQTSGFGSGSGSATGATGSTPATQPTQPNQ